MTAAQDKEAHDIAWVLSHLRRATSRKFYGRVTIYIEAGRIRRLVKEESVIPPGVSEKKT